MKTAPEVAHRKLNCRLTTRKGNSPMARRLDKQRSIARFHSGSSPSAGFLNGMHQIGPFSGSLASRLCRLREVLKQMDVQHGLQGNAATAPGGHGVERLDCRKQPLPGDNGVHLLQKLFLASLPAALHQVRIGQAKLLRGMSLRFRQVDGEIFA